MKPILLLAPIRGITDLTYRNLFSKHFGGFDYAIAPFFAIAHKTDINQKILREFKPTQDILLSVPQILSKDPEEFLTLASTLVELGYPEINWNLGCPHPVVVTKNKGSGLLRYPEQIDAFLDKVFPLMKGKLSIKLRLGYETIDDIFKLIPIFNRYPITELIIHARTGKQMYNGSTDKTAFEKCIPLSQHPLVYNGDINSIEDFHELSILFPSIKKWMIGRGAIRNPFLPFEIKGKNFGSYEKKIKIIEGFHDDLYRNYSRLLSSKKHLLDRMTGHWEYFSDFFPLGNKLFRKMRKIRTIEEYEERIKIIFKD